MFEAESRAFISLATLCLATDPPCSSEEWQHSAESDLFDSLIEELSASEARQLLSYVMGVTVALLEDVVAAQGVSAIDYLRMRGLQIAQEG